MNDLYFIMSLYLYGYKVDILVENELAFLEPDEFPDQ